MSRRPANFKPRLQPPIPEYKSIAFNGLRDKFKAAGAVLLGVSPDSAKSHDKFKKKHELQFPLAADETKSTLEAYGVWQEKSMYGRKYMGVERTTFLIGADGRIARIWRKVKVPGHAEEALAAARAILPRIAGENLCESSREVPQRSCSGTPKL